MIVKGPCVDDYATSSNILYYDIFYTITQVYDQRFILYSYTLIILLYTCTLVLLYPYTLILFYSYTRIRLHYCTSLWLHHSSLVPFYINRYYSTITLYSHAIVRLYYYTVLPLHNSTARLSCDDTCFILSYGYKFMLTKLEHSTMI